MTKNLLQDSEKLRAKVQRTMIIKMWRFYHYADSVNLAGLGPASDPVQYKTLRPSLKQKGGHPPRDMSAVEALVDFRLAMDHGEYEAAKALYFYLRRIIPVDTIPLEAEEKEE